MERNYLETLVENIDTKLGEMERNYAWLAKKSNLTPASISRIKTMDSSPNLTTIVAIAMALDVSPGELISRREIKQAESVATNKDLEDAKKWQAMEAKYAKHGPDILETLTKLKDHEIIGLRIDLGLPSLYREKKKPDESLTIRSNPQPSQEKPAVGSRDRKK